MTDNICHLPETNHMPTDPEQPRLNVVKGRPFNAETPLPALQQPITPTPNFYVRSNFDMPAAPAIASWALEIDGSLEAPFSITYADLLALPSVALTSTLECAGNSRLGLAPLPKGEPWASGAVSTAQWRGVPLADLLSRAGLRPSVVEILFTGADSGTMDNKPEQITFQRSLPLDAALGGHALLAYEMNGAPLPPEHGGPVRLIVPGWYGMASVKWLTRITAIDAPFTGFFQTQRYVYSLPPSPAETPVREILVKSLITSPAGGDTVPLAPCTISGLAWCGSAPVALVEVATEGAGAWTPATLIGDAVPYTWQQWQFTWTPPRAGRFALRSRATDAQGNTQPDQAPWNRLGYGNNAVQTVVVQVG
jgi:DMSO/TMAO reductase YedYZ molybdopterin-dependent catalytic subunit